MDWALAINRNRDLLMRIIASLFAMVGLAENAMPATLPRHVYRAVLRLLRPAESAVRRLVIIAARGLVLKPRASGAFPAGLATHTGVERNPAFCLIDPLKRFATVDFERGRLQALPRISVPGVLDPVFVFKRVANAEDPIAAGELLRRLQALKHALEHLPRQARRLARWRAKVELARQSKVRPRPGRLSPFRPGFAPGYHRHRPQEIDDILGDCHYFAVEAWKEPDTS